MVELQEMTDDQINTEWQNIAVLDVHAVTDEQRERFKALDAEAFKRKYDGKTKKEVRDYMARHFQRFCDECD